MAASLAPECNEIKEYGQDTLMVDYPVEVTDPHP